MKTDTNYRVIANCVSNFSTNGFVRWLFQNNSYLVLLISARYFIMIGDYRITFMFS